MERGLTPLSDRLSSLQLIISFFFLDDPTSFIRESMCDVDSYFNQVKKNVSS